MPDNEQKEFILAIDPGNKESAYVLLDRITLKPIWFNKLPNGDIYDMDDRPCWAEIVLKALNIYTRWYDIVYPCIEMVASYGMAVGADVFDTVHWIGWYWKSFEDHPMMTTPKRIYRKDEKMNLCHSMKANDSNITQALVDRFAPGETNHGKGTKKNPGWFYGFKKDIWQAYAVGVTYHDLYLGEKQNE